MQREIWMSAKLERVHRFPCPAPWISRGKGRQCSCWYDEPFCFSKILVDPSRTFVSRCNESTVSNWNSPSEEWVFKECGVYWGLKQWHSHLHRQYLFLLWTLYRDLICSSDQICQLHSSLGHSFPHKIKNWIDEETVVTFQYFITMRGWWWSHAITWWLAHDSDCT